uniref:Secreted salivary protein n=1 Tax=Culicoides nubeculosus TaxID=144565 RepID=B9URL6_CULNU|nr:secreted salivary protein [Culicoides nubeculosus]
MSLVIIKLTAILILLFEVKAQKPLFNDARDPLDLTGGDYYDDKQYPDLKNENKLYFKSPPGGLSTRKPVVKPNIPPDVEPIDSMKIENSLVKVGRIQGKTLWKEKTMTIPVRGTQFEVKSNGLNRKVKGVVIDMKKVKHNGFSVNMNFVDMNYIVKIQSKSPMSGTATVMFYTNPPWTKAKNKGNGKKGKDPNKSKNRQ